METKEFETQDKALNANAAIWGNVELPLSLAEATTLSGKVWLTKYPTGDKEGDGQGNDNETTPAPSWMNNKPPPQMVKEIGGFTTISR